MNDLFNDFQKSRSFLLKTDENGKTTALDLMPVETFIAQLEQRCKDRKWFTDSDAQHKALKSMNEEQLRYVASMLAHKAEYNARMWDSCFTREFYDFLKQTFDLKDMAKAQGVDLWPEMDRKEKA